MVGLTDTEAPREQSLCAWTIGSDQPFVVENATTDPRFQDNPMVMGDPHIHMYAGAPLITPAGHRIGTLCVTSDRPHPLSGEDLQSLQDLAALAMQELELRRSLLDATRVADAQRRQAEELLALYKRERVHVALVVDEFGGTLGFVTMDDLIEDVIAEEDAPTINWIMTNDDGSLTLDGEATLAELAEDNAVPLVHTDVMTIAGLILAEVGTVPAPGTTVHVQGHDLTVEDVQGLKITRVRVRPLAL
nr:transporter associated domain-containing protein [Deinococcus xianganensis]